MGTLLHSCVEVREPIELSFGAVSGVTLDIDVLDGGPCASREGWILGSFAPIGPMVSLAYFVTEMYLTHAWKVDNISAQTVHHWNLHFIGFPKICTDSMSVQGFECNWQKCNSWHMHNRHSAARCSSATCKMQTCRHVERQWVKRGPKFADRKCGHVGKMQTVILQTKWLIVIVLKNHEITISTMHWLIWTKFGLVWNLKFQSGRWQNYKQLSFLHCFNGNFGGNISS